MLQENNETNEARIYKDFSLFNVSIEILLDFSNFNTILTKNPILEVKLDEINSYKHLILSYLSNIGLLVIDAPKVFGFNNNIIPQMRYNGLESFWDRFKILGNYTGEVYNWLKLISITAKKIIYSRKITDLKHIREDLTKIRNSLGIKDKIGEKFSFLKLIDIGYNIHHTEHFDLFTKKEFIDFAMINNNFRPPWGYYKALFLLKYKIFNLDLNSEQDTKVLKELILGESILNDKISRICQRKLLNPYELILEISKFWPWIFLGKRNLINYFTKLGK